MTDFAVSGALFGQTPEDLKKRLKDKYDPNKNYPSFEGVLNIPADNAYPMAEYIMNGKPLGDRQEILIAVSGWPRKSASGKSYLSLSFKPHYKYEANVNADKAAENLAEATGGKVVEADDPFGDLLS